MAKFITKREARNRKLKFQIFAGMFDFMGMVLGLLVIVACIVLLRSLVSWVIADGEVTFATLFEILDSAIIKPE